MIEYMILYPNRNIILNIILNVYGPVFTLYLNKMTKKNPDQSLNIDI